jgi:uncharacterized FAD-dependent dehydrogenase
MENKSMPEEFDVILVGAGPAGIFACHELVNKNPKLKIALLDMGARLESRSEFDVMSGFGGAGTFSDGKLHFTPSLSHERTFHLIKIQEYQEILNHIDEVFMFFGVKEKEFTNNQILVEELINEA